MEACSHEHYLSSNENKALKNGGLYGIWTHDHCNTDAMFYLFFTFKKLDFELKISMHNSWLGPRPHLTFSHTYFRKLCVKFMIWHILILIALLRAWSGVTHLVQRWSGVLWETYSIRLNIIFSGLTKYFNCNLPAP